jgi:hypothetical protein
MNQEQNIESRLWDYIDGRSAASEKSAIEELLQSNYEWKNKYHELLDVNQLLKSSELEHPSMRFTKNVMEEISKLHIAPATKNYINKKIIWGIAAFFIIMVTGFVVYGFGQVDWSSGTGTGSALADKYIDLSKVDFSKIFNNNFVNVFMMVNVLLGLALLDRVLANKRKKFHKEA